MNFLINLLVSWIAVFVAAQVSPGIQATLTGAIIFALVLAVLNATVGFLLRLVTFPLNFLSLGLVSLVISYFMILLTDSFVDGFAINWWFWSVVIFSIILAVINALLWKKNEL